MRPWQRQPDEPPADFSAFVAYLRLKGRRSHRAAAAQTGRSPGAIRRLSTRFNWPARVAAFELRLADATQDALDSLLLNQPPAARAELEQFRIREFLLAQQVVNESKRWLKLASNPRRRLVPIGQLCRLIALASKLGRLATGMPTGDEPRRRPRKEDRPGYWTAPSPEEALRKIYGSPQASGPPKPAPASEAATPANPPAAASAPQPATGNPQLLPGNTTPVPPGPPPDDKHDLIPHKLVIGPHGLLCLQPLEQGHDGHA